MDAGELFLLRHEAIHGAFVDQLFAGLTEAQLRQRPHGVNSVIWLVWHAARVEDAVLNRFVADRAQVLDDGDWNRHLGLARRDVGPGMSGTEVQLLSDAVEVSALRGYQRAVAERTRALVAGLAPQAWDEVVDPTRVRSEVAAEGLLIDAGRWVEEFWASGRSRGWYVLQVGLLHPYGHGFEALVTRGLLGIA